MSHSYWISFAIYKQHICQLQGRTTFNKVVRFPMQFQATYTFTQTHTISTIPTTTLYALYLKADVRYTTTAVDSRTQGCVIGLAGCLLINIEDEHKEHPSSLERQFIFIHFEIHLSSDSLLDYTAGCNAVCMLISGSVSLAAATQSGILPWVRVDGTQDMVSIRTRCSTSVPRPFRWWDCTLNNTFIDWLTCSPYRWVIGVIRSSSSQAENAKLILIYP